MKRKVLISLITISLLIEGVLIYHLFSSNEILSEVREINLKEEQSIAIMVQDTEGGDWHEQEDRSKWPDPSTHGFVGAECSDSEGAPIDWEKVLTFSLANKTATIKTKQTAYCTLYFAKGEPALEWLKKKGGDTFAGSAHTTVVDGMYRFKGTNTQVLNNYICFGTSVESECLKTPETYMYRIIGITSAEDTTIGLYANQLKIIKATPTAEQHKWHKTSEENIKWDASDMKTYLNGTTENGNSNGFLQTIIDGIDGTYWESMISSHSWYNVDYTSVPVSEPQTSHSTESKIGLIYATDYVNAYQNNSTNNWLYIKNGWTTNGNYNEWTISRYGTFVGMCAWSVEDSGMLVEYNPISASFRVRPVFYLQSGVNLTGEGTKDHPYIIATMNNA